MSGSPVSLNQAAQLHMPEIFIKAYQAFYITVT